MIVNTDNINIEETEPNGKTSEFLLGSLFFIQYTKWLLMQ